MRWFFLLCLALLLASCAHGHKRDDGVGERGSSEAEELDQSVEPGGPRPGSSEALREFHIDLAALGSTCDQDGGCAPGLDCLRYYGIAGAVGPEFRTCEIACRDGASRCPEGSRCLTIMDGPGAVCRAAPLPDLGFDPRVLGGRCDEDGGCPGGLRCVEVASLGGPPAPVTRTCELPCGPERACPEGLACFTLEDGPGDVCRLPLVPVQRAPDPR
jgi:hypothetical protein